MLLGLTGETRLSAAHWQRWRQMVQDPREGIAVRLGVSVDAILRLCSFAQWDDLNDAAHKATAVEISVALRHYGNENGEDDDAFQMYSMFRDWFLGLQAMPKFQ